MTQRNKKGEIITPNDPEYIIGDEDLERLMEKYKESQKKANQQRAQLTHEQIHKYRARCKKDLFFLCSAVLGYRDLSVKFHSEEFAKVRTAFNEFQFLLMLWPRAHFKTSTGTVGHNIQCALPYTEEDEKYDEDRDIPVPYPANLGTDIRILIIHEIENEACRFLFMITQHFMNNPMLMALFPECVPQRSLHRINRSELELPRTGVYGEPTFDAKGVSAKQQGNHYNLIAPDDIYGREARDSDAETMQRKTFIDGIFGFLNNPSIDKIFAKGTRYKYDDVYGYMIDKFEDQLWVTRRKVEEYNPKTGQKEIVFKERITEKLLKIIKTDKKTYYSEWLNDPEEIGEGFDKTWWKTFEWIDSTRIAVFDGDKSKPSVVNIRDCYIAILIDPGEITGGFLVTATDYWWRTFTLIAIPIDFPSPALVELLFRQVQKWLAHLVSIEADAAQHLLGDWVKMEMNNRKIYFPVHEYYTKKQAKPKRIESLGQLYSANQLFHNETQTELKQEFERFGKSADIHLLDALAQLMDEGVRRQGFVPGSYGIITAPDGQHPFQQDIDPETGYSVIDLAAY